MKKPLINIGILLFLDFFFIYVFYIMGPIEGLDLPSFDRPAKWKIQAGQALLILVINLMLLRELAKAARRKEP